MALISDNSKDLKEIEEAKQKSKALNEKIEDTLMQEEMRNQDLNDLSSSLKTRVNVKYDLKTLVKSELVNDIEPELLD